MHRSKLVLPCGAAGYNVGAMSIAKGARNLAEAKKFYDWALTAEAQTIRDQTRVIAIPSNRSCLCARAGQGAGKGEADQLRLREWRQRRAQAAHRQMGS